MSPGRPARAGAAWRARLAAVRCVLLDVDGVLTDGRMWLSETGEEFVAFFVRDGHGIKRLLAAGLDVAVISGRHSAAARQRLEALGVRYIYQGREEKLPVFLEFMAAADHTPETTLYVGDDVADLPVMECCGLAVAVADAHPEMAAAVDWVTEAAGGRGAVREVADAILSARGAHGAG